MGHDTTLKRNDTSSATSSSCLGDYKSPCFIVAPLFAPTISLAFATAQDSSYANISHIVHSQRQMKISNGAGVIQMLCCCKYKLRFYKYGSEFANVSMLTKDFENHARNISRVCLLTTPS
jgi:hypothetical protein